MKTPFTLIIIASLLLSATLSLVTMGHMDQGHGDCPFDAVGTADCVKVASPFDFLASHLAAFLRFFSATPTDGVAILLALFLSLILSTFIIFDGDSRLFKSRPLLARNRLREFFVSPSTILFIDWLALHENSPAVS